MRWSINFGDNKGPCRVNQATASYKHLIFSFGGYSQSTSVQELKQRLPIDVHVLNTITLKWHKRPVPQPDHPGQQFTLTPYFRYGHTCVLGKNAQNEERILLWGGRSDWTNELDKTLYSYDPLKHEWSIVETRGEIPDGRDGHSTCVIDDAMYIFGGYVQRLKKFSNDVHEFNFITSTWSLIIPKSDVRPHWRDFHTSSAVGSQIYIFGGRMDSGKEIFTGHNFYSNDLFMFDTKTRLWTQLKKPFKHHQQHHVVQINQEGEVNNNYNNLAVAPAPPPNGGTLVITHQSPTREQLEDVNFSPCGRRSHSAIVYKDKIYIFGGFQENLFQHYNDFYEFDPATLRWKQMFPQGLAPSPRRRHGCCLVGNRAFFFGGTGPKISHHQIPPGTATSSAALVTSVAAQSQNLLQQILATIVNHNNSNNDNIGVVNESQQPQLEPPTLAGPATEQPISNADAAVVVVDNMDNNNDNNSNEDNDDDAEPLPIDDIMVPQLPPVQDEFDEQQQDGVMVAAVDAMFVDDDFQFSDSGEEDLVDQDSDTDLDDGPPAPQQPDEEVLQVDEDEFNRNLLSMSDMHVLEMDVTSLRTLCMIKVLEQKMKYATEELQLPKVIIADLNNMTNNYN